MILYISDFDLVSSGYMQISIAACNQLAKHEYDVRALGIGYSGNEHNWPFSIWPVTSHQAFHEIPAMLQNTIALSQNGQLPDIEAIVTALDIPMQERILSWPFIQHIPYVGIFPIESGPLCGPWADIIAKMDEPMVISKFGHHAMTTAGIEGTYWPVGIDTEAWRMPTKKEILRIRKSMGFTEDQFIVLTVADNQERKNLSAAMDAISKAYSKGLDVQWVLVTRQESQVGWKLNDMAVEKGIMDRMIIFERGLAFERLWMLYAMADAFLLTSKAEGLCMPIMEAMATGTAVIATDCTAIPEHLYENLEEKEGQRGLLIDVEYRHQDVWGNSIRSFCDSESAADQIKLVFEMKRSGELKGTILDPARVYVESRTWKKAGDVLASSIEKAKRKKRKAPDPPLGLSRNMKLTQPATVPHAIPIMEEEDGEEI